MKQGKVAGQIFSELEERNENRGDYSIYTKLCSVVSLGNVLNFRVGFKEQDEYFVITELAHRQICDWLGLPFKYYESFLVDKPTIFLNMLNSLFSKIEDYRTLRVVNNKLIAFLSNYYLKYDDLELWRFANKLVSEARGLNILSAELTPEKIYIKIFDKRISAKMTDESIIYAGYLLSNSEVGLGSIKVEPLIYHSSSKSCYIFKKFAKRVYHMDKSVEYISDRRNPANSKLLYNETANQDYLVAELIEAVMAEHPFAKGVASFTELGKEEMLSTGAFERIKKLGMSFSCLIVCPELASRIW